MFKTIKPLHIFVFAPFAHQGSGLQLWHPELPPAMLSMVQLSSNPPAFRFGGPWQFGKTRGAKLPLPQSLKGTQPEPTWRQVAQKPWMYKDQEGFFVSLSLTIMRRRPIQSGGISWPTAMLNPQPTSKYWHLYRLCMHLGLSCKLPEGLVLHHICNLPKTRQNIWL